jgi:hypothetical protein
VAVRSLPSKEPPIDARVMLAMLRDWTKGHERCCEKFCGKLATHRMMDGRGRAVCDEHARKVGSPGRIADDAELPGAATLRAAQVWEFALSTWIVEAEEMEMLGK